MIEQAFHAYTKAVETAFEARRRPTPTKRGLVEFPNKAYYLPLLVEQLEEGREFSALLEATRLAFRSDDWHSAKSESWWRDPIRQFFRRTGYYADTFEGKGSDTPCDLFERYEKAFQRRHVQTTYLAPVEFVKFPKPELEFSGFKLRKFDRNELDKIVGNDVNRVFYPYAVVDTDALDALQKYWFIMVTIPEKARRRDVITISKAAMGYVSPEYTRFPPEIERVLERLILFDWVGDTQDPSTYRGSDNFLPFGFNIPFVIRVDDNDPESPESAPDCSTPKSYIPVYFDPDTEEEHKAHDVLFNLNESRVVKFKECIRRADECLQHLRLEADDTHWPFLKVAIGNLIKAFFAEGLEQLLWHIIALEALLSERGPGVTKSLARRSAAILGATEQEKTEWKKKFDELYDLRSALVHGRKFKKDVHRKQLFEARMMVMRVMIWFVHYLGEIAARINEGVWPSEVPKREDFLVLLDLSHADRDRLSVLLSNLPTGFPTVPAWSP